MENLVRKAMRIEKPREVKCLVRPCVYEWLCATSDKLQCNNTVLVRGILEDAYDRYHVVASNAEVSGNE